MNVIAYLILAVMLLSVFGMVVNVIASGPTGIIAACMVLAVIATAWTIFWHLFKPRS